MASSPSTRCGITQPQRPLWVHSFPVHRPYLVISPRQLCKQIGRSVLEGTYGIMLPAPPEGEDENRPATAHEFLGAHACERFMACLFLVSLLCVFQACVVTWPTKVFQISGSRQFKCSRITLTWVVTRGSLCYFVALPGETPLLSTATWCDRWAI